MIEGLEPYPEYRSSGIPWMPKMPTTWKTRRAKWLFTKMNRSVEASDEVVTCFRDGMVTLRKNRRLRGFTEAAAEIGYQGIRKGDLVIHNMDAFAGAVGVSDSDGKGTPVYSVCKPKVGADPRYFALAVREMAISEWILALAKGIRQRSTDFRFETFGRQIVPLPSLEEQAAIVRFLGHANRKIDTFIRTKRKLIGLLNEQKQTIIHRAVTRGLNPDVPYKPSGIKWVGEIPKHWDVLRAKYLFREVDERSKTGNEEMLSVSHLTGVTPRSEKNITMFKAESNVGHKICRPGDLAINTMWAWMAALGFARHHGVISPAYGVYRQRTGERFEPEYADLLLRTEAYKTNYLMRSTGIRASRLRLYPEEFFKIPILVPPKNEQREIVEYLKKETKEIDESLSRVQSQIKLMQEYRTRLTADIVTGKLDVREAAKTLLEPTEERAMEVLTEDLEDEMLGEPEIEEINE